MIINVVYMFNVISLWLNAYYLYLLLCQRKGFIRRWWVKPHITDAMRDMFGAYDTLFLYFTESDHEEFQKMTRMTLEQFEGLYNLVQHRLEKRSLRRPLSKRLRLAVTLNYLANGDSNRTTSNFFRIGVSTSYKIIEEVCRVVWDCLSPIYLARQNAFDWQLVSRGFRLKWGYSNCLGAMDGKELQVKLPPHSGSMFFNYIKFYSFKLLAACDAYYRFLWIDVGDYGSVSDISAFQYTDLYYALENNLADLPPNAAIPGTNTVIPYSFVRDAIFTLKSYMMRPYARHVELTQRQRTFNARLSRARYCIENAFGFLVTRWQILHKKLNFKLKTSVTIVQALVCLHNYIVTEELLMNEEERNYTRIDNEVRQYIIDNERDSDDKENIELIPINVIQQRELLADYFMSEEAALH